VLCVIHHFIDEIFLLSFQPVYRLEGFFLPGSDDFLRHEINIEKA
jgi:hypothetical protein